MKTLLTLLLKIILLLFVLLTVGWFLFIQPPRFIFQIGLPDIAKDLPAGFQSADQEFNRRVQETYSNEMTINDLKTQLENEGFEVNNNELAQVTRSRFPCTLSWRITWTVDGSSDVSDIKGKYGGSCL